MSIDFCGINDDDVSVKLSEIVTKLSEVGPVTFTIDRDPNIFLKTIWDKDPGTFVCYLVEENGPQRTVRIEAPKTCCGGNCH